MHKTISHTFKWLHISLLTIAILIAVILICARITVAVMNNHTDSFEKWSSRWLGQSVHIEKVTTGWHGFSPTLHLRNIAIRHPKTGKTILSAQDIVVDIRLFPSLFHRKLLPEQFVFSGVKVNLEAGGASSAESLSQRINALVPFLMKTNITLQQASINYHAANGSVISIKGVQLQVKNNDTQHIISAAGHISPGASTSFASTPFKFLINLKGHGNTFDADTYFEGRLLPLYDAMLKDALKAHVNLLPARKSMDHFQIWAAFQAGELQSVRSLFHVQDLALAGQVQPHQIDDLQGRMDWKKNGDGWTFTVEPRQWRVDGAPWQGRVLGMQAVKTPDRHSVLLKASYFNISEGLTLNDMVHSSFHQKIIDAFQKWSPQGELHNFALLYTPSQVKKPMYYHWQTQFAKVALHSKTLSGTNLSGSVEGYTGGGKIRLDTKQSLFILPHYPKREWHVQNLHFVGDWERQSSGWKWNISDSQFQDGNLTWQGTSVLTWPSSGSPTINLQGNFSLKDVSQINSYFPDSTPHNSFLSWIRQFFLKGSMTDGILQVQGPLKHFPFKKHDGKFRMSGNFHNLSFRYDKKWPVVTHAELAADFQDGHFRGHLKSGETAGNPLSQIIADIPDQNSPVLTLIGNSKSTLDKGLAFLRATPLSVKTSFDNMTFAGPMDLRIKVVLPLGSARLKEDKQVDGDILMNHGQLTLDTLKLPISNIQGKLHFSTNSLSADKLTAQLAPHLPMTIHIATAHESSSDASTVRITTGGLADIQVLKRFIPTTMLEKVQGVSAYRALISIIQDPSQHEVRLNIASDLSGISSTLPAPFNKTKDQTRLLVGSVSFKGDTMEVRLDNKDQVSFIGKFNKKLEGFQLASGELHFGKGVAQDLSAPGLLVSGQLNQFDSSLWNAYRTRTPGQEKSLASSSSSLLSSLRGIHLLVNRLIGWGHDFGAIQVNMQKISQGWEWALQSKQVSGKFIIPEVSTAAWRGSFKYLYWPKLSTSKTSNSKATPAFTVSTTKIPAIDFSVADFRYGKTAFGTIKLKTSSTPRGFHIDTLTVMNPLLYLQASGDGLYQEGRWKTLLSGRFQTTKLGSALQHWNMSTALQDGKGLGKFNLAWDGFLHEAKISNMKGHINFKFWGGQFLKLDQRAQSELDIIRILALLNWFEIPSRLLSFGKSGLPFNLLEGDASLSKGIVKVDKFSVDTDAGWMYMKGDIGLAKKDYGLQVKVVPNLTFSVPLIATATAGPLVGVAAWIINKMLAPEVNQVAQKNYTVTGSWEHPKFKSVG